MLNPYIDASSSPDNDANDPDNYDQLPPSSTMVITTTCDCYHCTGIASTDPINTYEEDFAL